MGWRGQQIARKTGAGLRYRVGEEIGVLGANLKLNGRRSQTSWLRQLLLSWGNLSWAPGKGVLPRSLLSIWTVAAMKLQER